MAHEISPFQDDPFLEIGRILHSESYKRERKEVKTEGNFKDGETTRGKENKIL